MVHKNEPDLNSVPLTAGTILIATIDDVRIPVTMNTDAPQTILKGHPYYIIIYGRVQHWHIIKIDDHVQARPSKSVFSVQTKSGLISIQNKIPLCKSPSHVFASKVVPRCTMSWGEYRPHCRFSGT